MTCPYLLVYPLSVRLSIRNDNSLIRTKTQLPFFRVKAALLRYIVFYCGLGCDTSEPHVSYISRACSSLVRQPYYIPNRFLLKISGLETILATKKGHWDGRSFYMDEYTLIFLFSWCIRCAQKRDCWESVRFASERSRVRIPPGPPYCANPSSIFFVKHCFGFVFVLRGCGSVRFLFFCVSGIAWRGAAVPL